MKRIKSIRGVEIYETKSGVKMVYIRYQSGGKGYLEKIGPSEKKKGRDVALAKARQVLEQRRRDIANARAQGKVWRSPKEQARYDKEQAEKQNDARQALLFEAAVKRFLEACGDSYSRPTEVRQIFENRLALFFGGRLLDEISRRDIREYEEHRLNATGPFKDCRKVGLRPPQIELTKLSALYGFLIYDEERDMDNPCSRPRAFRLRRKKAEVYRPVRKAVIPSPAAVRALFESVPIRKDGKPFGRRGLAHRALFKMLYYTGARPESEACQLTHGDVELPEPGKVRRLDGRTPMVWLTFRDTKTGGDRRVPLHPEAEDDLRAIMEDRPSDPAELERWRRLPIFRKKEDKSDAMDKDSYRKTWANTRDAASVDHSELAGMVVRDFRKTFRTFLTNAKVPEPTILRLMGHSVNVSQGYHELTDEVAERAVMALSLTDTGAQVVYRNRVSGDEGSERQVG